MPLVMVCTIKGNYEADINALSKMYPLYFEGLKYNLDKCYIEAILVRIYDSDGNKIRELFERWILPCKVYIDSLMLNLKEVALKYSIPTGYFIVLVVYGIRISRLGSEKYYVVLPDNVEYITSESNLSETDLSEELKRDLDIAKMIAKEYEYLAMLSAVRLTQIGKDLVEALYRYNLKDYDGAIKFFRKVVEGIRDYLKNVEKIDNIEGRAEALLDYTKKAYHLLSNFGEHHGTFGDREEAELAKEITLGLIKYVTSKIKTGKVTPKQQGGKQ